MSCYTCMSPICPNTGGPQFTTSSTYSVSWSRCRLMKIYFENLNFFRCTVLKLAKVRTGIIWRADKLVVTWYYTWLTFTFAGCTPYVGLCCIHCLSFVLFFRRELFALHCGSRLFWCFDVLDQAWTNYGPGPTYSPFAHACLRLC